MNEDVCVLQLQRCSHC